MIVAEHEVPGKVPSKVPSRRVQPIPEVFLVEMCAMSNRCAHLHESYRTLRDGSLGWRCPRHFVPGYDRIVLPRRYGRPRMPILVNDQFYKSKYMKNSY